MPISIIDDSYALEGILSIGDKGADGFSPVITLEKITSPDGIDGERIIIEDALGTHNVDIFNGASIKDIILEQCEEDNVPFPGIKKGEYYLKFEMQGSTDPIYVSLANYELDSDNVTYERDGLIISVSDALDDLFNRDYDLYEAGNGLEIVEQGAGDPKLIKIVDELILDCGTSDTVLWE